MRRKENFSYYIKAIAKVEIPQSATYDDGESVRLLYLPRKMGDPAEQAIDADQWLRERLEEGGKLPSQHRFTANDEKYYTAYEISYERIGPIVADAARDGITLLVFRRRHGRKQYFSVKLSRFQPQKVSARRFVAETLKQMRKRKRPIAAMTANRVVSRSLE